MQDKQKLIAVWQHGYLNELRQEKQGAAKHPRGLAMNELIVVKTGSSIMNNSGKQLNMFWGKTEQERVSFPLQVGAGLHVCRIPQQGVSYVLIKQARQNKLVLYKTGESPKTVNLAQHPRSERYFERLKASALNG